jgi:hypothetical protein
MRLLVVEVLAFLVVFFGFGQIAAAASSGAVHITVRIRPPDAALLTSKPATSKPALMLAGAALVYQVSLANFSSTANVKLPLSLESRPWTVRYA